MVKIQIPGPDRLAIGFCLLFNMSKPAGRQYKPNKSRQGGHKRQIPKKFQITIPTRGAHAAQALALRERLRGA
jgi:hypothetical protein